MTYLNVILTILCLILGGYLGLFIFFWVKYGKKLLDFFKQNTLSSFQSFNGSSPMEDSLRMINTFLGKKN